MPDTSNNQRRWPQSAGQKPGSGFPLLRLVGLFSLGSPAMIEKELCLHAIGYNLLWMGGFVIGEGFSLQHNVVRQLTAGTHSVSASFSWRIPETGFINPQPSPFPTSGIVGFTSGPRPDDLTLGCRGAPIFPTWG